MAREPDLLQDYINKARYIAETLSNLTVELADKGCMSYKQANKAHELIMDVLRVLARRQWSSINFVCDRIANIMDTIADAWKECQKA